jgi:tetratricopeptide (TPR) repeat protein
LGLCLGSRTFDLALKSQPTDAPLATEALSHLENVIILARKLGSRWDEAKAHDHQSRIWLELGDYVRAYAANDANLELVHELGEDKMQVAGCIMVSGNIARSQGDYALAQSCYERAIKMFRDHPYSASIQTYGLSNLGYAALGLGNYAQARSCFGHKLRWDWKNSVQFVAIAFDLATFASLSCELGEPERAAKLAGAVDAYLSQQNVRLQGADRIDYERRIASVIRDLGEPAFAAWFAEGHHMSLEEAVMFALEELPGTR